MRETDVNKKDTKSTFELIIDLNTNNNEEGWATHWAPTNALSKLEYFEIIDFKSSKWGTLLS